MSTEEDVYEKVNIYPNPTSSTVTVEIADDNFLGGTISIYDLSGKIQEKTLIESKKTLLHITNKKGLYFVNIEKEGLSKSFKVLKYND